MVSGVTKYYLHFRSDVLAHVPSDAKEVLSVGCGAGVTEAELIQRNIRVTGIEIDARAAEIARQNGLEVLLGDATASHQQLVGKSFDCVIYADVLEHIIDPVSVLRLHVPLLRPGGKVIISIPNFRHVSVLYELVFRGHVIYVDAGILDRTHIRMTTRRMVEEWISSVGLERLDIKYRMNRRREVWLSACLLGLAREFLASQVIVTARKAI